MFLIMYSSREKSSIKTVFVIFCYNKNQRLQLPHCYDGAGIYQAFSFPWVDWVFVNTCVFHQNCIPMTVDQTVFLFIWLISFQMFLSLCHSLVFSSQRLSPTLLPHVLLSNQPSSICVTASGLNVGFRGSGSILGSVTASAALLCFQTRVCSAAVVQVTVKIRVRSADGTSRL